MNTSIRTRKLSLVKRSEPPLESESRCPLASSIDGDAALVTGALGGDAACKEHLYRKHVDYIAGMCARLLRSVEASEDAVQDTFVIALEGLGTLRDPRAFRGWLAAIAVSQVRRRLAKQRLLRLLGFDQVLEVAPLDELAHHDTSAETRLELAALDLVLRTLPPNQRIAWMLQHIEGEPLDHIAVACRCSLATVKRWIAAADRRVQEHVRWVTEEPALGARIVP